ncbi:MAG: DUF1566 domain-containing protein [Myxococcales bacterium]|jgi:hypothetical protein|nr:DUF1566 domain-containing protein [Myxococcales bacterium]
MSTFQRDLALLLLGTWGLFALALGCSSDAAHDDSVGDATDSERGAGSDDVANNNNSDSDKHGNNDSDSGTGAPEPVGPLTWVDETTGLEWEVSPPDDGDSRTSLSRCNNLVLDGHQDWRVPNLIELRSLIRGCPVTELGGACPFGQVCREEDGCVPGEVDTIICYQGCERQEGLCYWPDELRGGCGSYWASYEDDDGITHYPYAIYFRDASIENRYHPLFHTHAVRCVRGEQMESN